MARAADLRSAIKSSAYMRYTGDQINVVVMAASHGATAAD
jgi:hypothetical protein